MSDPIFLQLSSTDGLLGAFSMTTAGQVIQSIGDFQGESADLHSPVIISILLDAKLILDTKPLTRTNTSSSSLKYGSTDPIKRIVITYQSFTLSIAIVRDIVYVVKVININESNMDDENMIEEEPI